MITAHFRTVNHARPTKSMGPDPSQENLEKNDLPFEAWVTSRNVAYREQHLIDDTPDLWMATALPEFVRHRDRLIRQKLLSLTVQEAA